LSEEMSRVGEALLVEEDLEIGGQLHEVLEHVRDVHTRHIDPPLIGQQEG